MQNEEPLPFGALLHMYRKQADLTQNELAAQVGLTAATISAYETSKRRPPRTDQLRLICDALQLEAEARDTLSAAAKRARGWLLATWGKGQDQQPVTVRTLSTPSLTVVERIGARARTHDARTAVQLYEEWYGSRLSRELEVSLSVAIWCPDPEPQGPIAAVRNEILEQLRNLGHRPVLSTQLTHVGNVEDGQAGEPDLIVIIAEDDSAVIEKVVRLCQQMDILPIVRAMLPGRYEFVIAAELETLINGFNGVLWYSDHDLKNSSLVKETLRCCEARRRVKAFKAFWGDSSK